MAGELLGHLLKALAPDQALRPFAQCRVNARGAENAGSQVLKIVPHHLRSLLAEDRRCCIAAFARGIVVVEKRVGPGEPLPHVGARQNAPVLRPRGDLQRLAGIIGGALGVAVQIHVFLDLLVEAGILHHALQDARAGHGDVVVDLLGERPGGGAFLRGAVDLAVVQMQESAIEPDRRAAAVVAGEGVDGLRLVEFGEGLRAQVFEFDAFFGNARGAGILARRALFLRASSSSILRCNWTLNNRLTQAMLVSDRARFGWRGLRLR